MLLPASINPKSTPQINLLINHHKILALLDTGASHCFINHKTAQELKLPIDYQSLPNVTIGNSMAITPLGTVSISFYIAQQSFMYKFVVLKSIPFKIVLGSNFIKFAKLIPDLDEGIFYFKNKPQHQIHFKNSEYFCALQGLSADQEESLQSLLSQFPEVLNDKIGCSNILECKLIVDSKPIAQRPYPTSHFKRELIKSHVEKMLKLGIIRPSESEWASPVNMVREDNDTFRFTLDYRKLNQVSKSDPYNIPRIDSLLHRLGDACFITKIDARKGYWQISMHPNSIKYTAFICDEGKYEFLRMPFGLKTAPSIFQRFMNGVLGESRGIFADVYIDDIIIYSNSWEEHLKHIEFILSRLRKVGLTVNLEKCSFGKTMVKYLGFIITPDGISTDPEKISAVSQYPIPKTPKNIKQFLGLCGWYRHFIPNLSEIAEPLNKLLKKSSKFEWTESQHQAFTKLKDTIINAAVLAYPDFSKRFILRTDSSSYGLGCVLAQKSLDGIERPIAFASRSLSKCELNYDACEKECLGIVWALKKFEHYLDGIEFDLETDNRALVWLSGMKNINTKFMRWSLKIQDFQAVIKHIPGRLNVVADVLSRAPVGICETEEDKKVIDPLAAFPNAYSSILCTLSHDITLESLKSTQSQDPETQALLTDIPNMFVVEDEILYKISPQGSRLPFIPKALRESILQYFHDSPMAGHFGYRKTLQRLLRRVFWFGMHEDIYAYIRTCHICQTVKNPNTKPHGELKSHKTQGPWDTLAIDFMGPLPMTQRKNTQLLVIVDHFTKWVELFALPDATGPRVCKVLENEIFCRWGSPKYILSDNAKNFRCSSLSKLCKAWNVKQKFTTTYHPQTNIAERVNRNIRAVLSSYIAEKHTKWDEYLATTALALRTAVSDTTGFSPSLLNLGRELQLPFDRNVEPNMHDYSSRTNYSTEIIRGLQSAYSKAKLSMERAYAHQAKSYNSRHKLVTFQVDDLVLLKSHFLSDKSKRFTKKFAYRWTGPFKVMEVVSPITYKLEIPNSDFKVHNVKNLKIYHDRPSEQDSFNIIPENEQNFGSSQSSALVSSGSSGTGNVTSYNLRPRAK